MENDLTRLRSSFLAQIAALGPDDRAELDAWLDAEIDKLGADDRARLTAWLDQRRKRLN